MSSIPEDVFHDILLRLPVKSLLACKCVCKNWFSLVSSTDFVKTHHNFAIQRNVPTTLLLVGCDPWRSKSIFSIGYDSCEQLLSKLLSSDTDRFVEYALEWEIDYPFKSLDYYVQLIGCCNGLVCLWFSHEHFFCLWNPATREYKEIPHSDITHHADMVAFGYDYKSCDYKLLAGGRFGYDCLFEVFLLGSNSWRTIPNIQYDFDISRHSGVLVNGEFHWLARGQDSWNALLVSLDISNEIFKEMEFPKELSDEMEKRRREFDYDYKFLDLGVVESYLCLFVIEVEVRVDVWVLQNYGVPDSWTKRYSLNDERIRNDHSSRLMWSFKSGEILFGGVSTGLLLCVPRDDKVIKPTIYSLAMLFQEECYFESLVSLKSGTFIGEESRVVSHIFSASITNTREEPCFSRIILGGTLVGHSDMVTAIACPTDNSSMIVSSSRDKSIIVWTLNKQEGNYGVPKHRLTGHNHFVQDVALSSDAQSVISGSLDGELRLWDLNTGVNTRSFVGHTKDVLSVAFSADNSKIVSASRDRSIKVWNTLGECKHTIQDDGSRNNWVSCVRKIVPPTFVSASWDKTVKVWNLTNCMLKNTLAGHGGCLNTVAVSPDGSVCASGSKDGVALVWNFDHEGQKLYSLDAGGIIHGLCFSPTRYWLCAATLAGVKIWDLESKSVLYDLKVEPEPGKNKTFYCSCLNWSSDGDALFVGYSDGSIGVWVDIHSAWSTIR